MSKSKADVLNHASQQLADDTLTFLIEQSRSLVTDGERLVVIERATELVVGDLVDFSRDRYGGRIAREFRKGFVTTN